jgi:hypothetical protein
MVNASPEEQKRSSLQRTHRKGMMHRQSISCSAEGQIDFSIECISSQISETKRLRKAKGRNVRTPADIALELDEGVPGELLRALLLKADEAAASLPTAAPTSGLEAA